MPLKRLSGGLTQYTINTPTSPIASAGNSSVFLMGSSCLGRHLPPHCKNRAMSPAIKPAASAPQKPLVVQYCWGISVTPCWASTPPNMAGTSAASPAMLLAM